MLIPTRFESSKRSSNNKGRHSSQQQREQVKWKQVIPSKKNTSTSSPGGLLNRENPTFSCATANPQKLYKSFVSSAHYYHYQQDQHQQRFPGGAQQQQQQQQRQQEYHICNQACMEQSEIVQAKDITFDSDEDGDVFLRLNISGRRYRLLKRTIIRKEEERRGRSSIFLGDDHNTFNFGGQPPMKPFANNEDISSSSSSTTINPLHHSSTMTKSKSILSTTTTRTGAQQQQQQNHPSTSASANHPQNSLLYQLVDPRIPLNDKIVLCSGYLSSTNEFYFERSSAVFDSIIDYYRSAGCAHQSILHTPTHICPENFAAELSFWGLPLTLIGNCCFGRFEQLLKADLSQTTQNDLANGPTTAVDVSYSCSETVGGDGGEGGAGTMSSPCDVPLNGSPRAALLVHQHHQHQYDKSSSNHNHKKSLDELEADRDSIGGGGRKLPDQFTNACCGKVRRVTFDFMEDPGSSKAAKIFGLISVGIVMISVLDLIIASLPEFQVHKSSNDRDPKPHWILQYTEIGCIVWFTSEYLIRLMITARKCEFLKNPQNLIDVLSVLPFYVELSLDMSGINIEKLSNVRGALLTLRILRVLRVARIFKLAKYSGGLQSFGQTLKASYREIGMLMLFLSTTIVLFSTTVYFLEKDVEETPFISIPATFWWCIVTMTTVGYGDMTPVTVGGKLVASLTSVSGVIVLAFPITIIVENFNKYYRMGQGSKAGDSQTGGADSQIRTHSLPRIHGFGVM